jgi:crotonobetainyl-CoA:carnitine CoA-transferase CaiB-like acyl-CoA transferase
VLKVENPQSCDPARVFESDPDHPFRLFGLVNSYKKSITLNLKHTTAREISHRLVSHCDVFVEGFRPGVMDKLGLGYDAVKSINPRIIYVSLSGFGQSGPYCHKAGHDLNYQALAGSFHSTFATDASPQVPNILFADLGGGSLLGLAGILAAIVQRENTGVGQYIDVSLFDGIFSLNLLGQCNFLDKRVDPNTADSVLLGTQPFYHVFYRTQDNRHMALGAVEFKFWKNFCITVGREDLIYRQYDGRSAIDEVSKIIRTRTLSEWSDLFEHVEACVTPILSTGEAIMSKLVKSRLLWVDDGVEKPHPLPPFNLSGSPHPDYSPAPDLGQHNESVLSIIGYSKGEIKEFVRKGII